MGWQIGGVFDRLVAALVVGVAAAVVIATFLRIILASSQWKSEASGLPLLMGHFVFFLRFSTAFSEDSIDGELDFGFGVAGGGGGGSGGVFGC